MNRIALAGFGLLATGAANAEVSYNYFELGYQDTELDLGFVEVDGDGFFGGLSFSITDSYFFVGDYGSVDIEGIDLERLRAGIGFHTDVNEPVQFVAQATFQRLEAADSENGYGVSVGGRGEISPGLEWDVFVDYVDFDDADTGFSGELRYKFTPQFAVGVQYETIDELDSIGLHFRWLYAN
ncbi:MAG: hypothetical protein AAGC71_15140 [Pseudomonadota bacterium]